MGRVSTDLLTPEPLASEAIFPHDLELASEIPPLKPQ